MKEKTFRTQSSGFLLPHLEGNKNALQRHAYYGREQSTLSWGQAKGQSESKLDAEIRT